MRAHTHTLERRTHTEDDIDGESGRDTDIE